VNTLKNQSKDITGKLLYSLALSSASSVILIFLGIFYCLVEGSLPAFKEFGFRFLYDTRWDPVLSQFSAVSSIKGTLISSFIALTIAIPISFGITVFILKIAPKGMRKSLQVGVDLLAGIPSIIYGMWGLFSFAPFVGAYIQPVIARLSDSVPFIGSFFEGPQIGIGLFTAGLVLGIMVIPFIASIMHDVFELVPHILEESSYALGATTWETIWNVTLPYGRVGLIGGIMLGLGRALGETMAVAFVIGNAHTMTTTLFSPANSITSTLANEFTEASSQMYTSALIELGLLLFLVTTIVVSLSALLLQWMYRRNK
jgi:phosphate transport system permease protein